MGLKKPTFAQKKRIVKAGMNWQSVLVKKDGPDGLVVVNKETNVETIIA